MIVKLLLVHGADPTLKNKHGNTPADESTTDIREIFEHFKKDSISFVVATLTLTDLVDSKIHHICFKGKIIAKEIKNDWIQGLGINGIKFSILGKQPFMERNTSTLNQ